MDKLLHAGVPLRECAREKQYFGIKSGCNEAFYITEEQRQALVKEEPASAKIIRPLLRGRDIDRWRPRLYPQFLLFMRRGIDLSRYPAVKRHLSRFRELLEPRPPSWTSPEKEWPGRKPGSYKWYELQDAVDYFPMFEKPKRVFQRIGFHSRIAFDDSGRFPNDSTTCLPVDNLYCCALLNSHVLWWFMWRFLPHMKDEALFMNGTKLDHVPIADAPSELKERIEDCARQLLALQSKAFELERNVISDLTGIMGVSFKSGLEVGDLAEKVGAWLRLPSSELMLRLCRAVELGQPPASFRVAGEQIAAAASKIQTALLRDQLIIEQGLAELVETAYGLTPEERALLHSTRPVRDPLDVLEAKIRGGREAETNSADE
jgi:hypothetical protein